MTKSQLEAVYDALVELADSWNDAAANEDRGRGNKFLILTIADDGSGMIGQRDPYKPSYVSNTLISDHYEFKDFDEFVNILKDGEGVEIEEER